jgi:protein-L-isoaspartate O-methyltransferase
MIRNRDAHRTGWQELIAEVPRDRSSPTTSGLISTRVARAVQTADGVDGHPDGAPYDRVLATAAVREIVPRAWLGQTRPDGLIVTP